MYITHLKVNFAASRPCCKNQYRGLRVEGRNFNIPSSHKKLERTTNAMSE